MSKLPAYKYKLDNGELVPLTKQEIAELEARDAAWAKAHPELTEPVVEQSKPKPEPTHASRKSRR